MWLFLERFISSSGGSFGFLLTSIVEALKDYSPILSLIRQVVEDIKALPSSITGALSTHALRQTNGVAHRLAHVGVTSSQSSEWLVSPL
ncbi:hypothetical protein D8674_034128 [Pyrus ussuriensis x Pyrus communis]|uniref:Uncharacterized protein n=1 Tax=Pyrus ussuriensis x Pyrus communis TaxID=2448454 RepID=A0A5N5HRK0_9ROSA|nr:hypothetical protein D8674_034128 [Pyrus ussuriensis x Pyrus communis]